MTDAHGIATVEHAAAVASNCPLEARVVAWVHDLPEDGLASLAELARKLSLTATERTALELLTHRESLPYTDYIEQIARSRGTAGELARTVKRADLEANLARPKQAERPDLRARYVKALARLGD